MSLSVLMSVYGKENPEFLRESLESIATQTRLPDEVVIVEDGPLGIELEAVISDFLGRLPVVLTRLPVNIGLGGALRTGLVECKGEYVARMDSDDICAPDRFHRQMEFLESHPGVDVVGSAIVEFDEDPSVPQSIRTLPESGRALRRFARFRTPMNHVTVIFRKASVIAAGNYEASRFFQDYQLWARMLALGYHLHNMSEVLVYVRCGNGMQARRGGLAYLKEEIHFQAYLRTLGLQDTKGVLWNILVRGPIRLAPGFVRALCYRIFLRSRPSNLSGLLSNAAAATSSAGRGIQ